MRRRAVLALIMAGLRRLRRHPANAALLVVGLIAPVAVSVAVPVYSSAASARLFEQQVADDGQPVQSVADRLALLYSFNRLSSGGGRPWTELAELDAVMFDGGGLPLSGIDRFVETIPLPASTADERFGSVTFSSVTGFEEDVQLLDGRLPNVADASGGEDAGTVRVEAIVEATLAAQNGLGVGQTIDILFNSANGDGAAVEIVGIWTDSESGGDTAPFGDADAFRRRLLVPHQTIVDEISPQLAEGIQNVRWRLSLEAGGFDGDDVADILGDIDRLTATADRLVPGTQELRSPSGVLRTFSDDEESLRTGLASFSAPLLVLSFAVGLMLVGIALRTRLGEFRTLRRRGVSRLSLVVGNLPEAVVVAVGAAVLGVGAGRVLAEAMGRTDTFFRFGGADDLAFGLGADVWLRAAQVGLILVMVQLVPLAILIWRIAPDGRTSGEVETPWYQRTNLDLVVVLVVVIITWRGVTSDSGRAELLDDPAIVLLPSAAAVAGGLMILRIVPVVMRGVAALLARSDRSASLIAARRAARVPADLAAPLLLLVVTASLATFTASLATTLDLQLADAALHRNGGLVRMIDTGTADVVVTTTDSPDDAIPPPPRTSTRHAPLDAYERVWGVKRASASIEVDGTGVHDDGELRGFRFQGIDPVTFAATSFWRSDFADLPLGELLQPLVERPNAVLIASPLARAEGLDVGDDLRLDLRTSAGSLQLPAVVAGTFEQFPRWYPELESPLIVGRADVVETLVGVTHDRIVLLEVDERFGDRLQVENDLAMFGASRPTLSAAALAIDAGRDEPGRQGVLGLLTVGVGLAATLTLVGFVVSTIGSLRRRTTELGVLRAMGMTRREVSTMALFDLAAVMTLGLIASLGLGVAFSRWFIPVLVDTPPGSAPELLPAIAWSAIAVLAVALAALLAIASLLVVALLRRIRLYEAIRLGEG